MARSGYHLSLDAEDVALAREELGEDPAETQSHIEALRAWVLQQKHFTTRTDDETLLMFLRQAKFSQLRARGVLERFTKNRVTSPHSVVYCNRAPIDEKTLHLIRSGFTFPLPGIARNGARTCCYNPPVVDTTPYSYFDMCRTSIVSMDVLMRDPYSQVHGVQYIINHKDVPLSYFLKATPTAMKVLAAALMDTMPARLRGCHFVNSPTAISAALLLLKTFVSAKLGSRIHNYWHDLRPVQELMDPSDLPNELGGTAGTFQQLGSRWADYLEGQSEQFDYFRCVSYDESKKMAPTKSNELEGAFRKLNTND